KAPAHTPIPLSRSHTPFVPSLYSAVFSAASHPSSFLRLEDHFDGLLEQPRDLERERKARIVFFGFDRIDRLTGNAEFFGEVALRPLLAGAELAQSILHASRLSTIRDTIVAACTPRIYLYRQFAIATPINQRHVALTRAPPYPRPGGR